MRCGVLEMFAWIPACITGRESSVFASRSLTLHVVRNTKTADAYRCHMGSCLLLWMLWISVHLTAHRSSLDRCFWAWARRVSILLFVFPVPLEIILICSARPIHSATPYPNECTFELFKCKWKCKTIKNSRSFALPLVCLFFFPCNRRHKTNRNYCIGLSWIHCFTLCYTIVCLSFFLSISIRFFRTVFDRQRKPTAVISF